jgi:hypothetical protein
MEKLPNQEDPLTKMHILSVIERNIKLMEPKPLTAEEEADMNSFTSLGTFGKVKFN